MPWYVALAIRGLINGAALLAGAFVFLVCFLTIYFGIAGTGGFTADPLPDHVPWLNLVIVGAIGAALECLILWVWRALTRRIDATEAK